MAQQAWLLQAVMTNTDPRTLRIGSIQGIVLALLAVPSSGKAARGLRFPTPLARVKP